MCHAIREEGFDIFWEQDIIQVNNNTISKALIPLEGLFDKNDQAKRRGISINPKNYKEHEIFPSKFLKIGICNILEEIKEIIQLWKVYVDIITQSYDDLKFFDKSIIQHTIELIEDAKLDRQK